MPRWLAWEGLTSSPVLARHAGAGPGRAVLRSRGARLSPAEPSRRFSLSFRGLLGPHQTALGQEFSPPPLGLNGTPGRHDASPPSNSCRQQFCEGFGTVKATAVTTGSPPDEAGVCRWGNGAGGGGGSLTPSHRFPGRPRACYPRHSGAGAAASRPVVRGSGPAAAAAFTLVSF